MTEKINLKPVVKIGDAKIIDGRLHGIVSNHPRMPGYWEVTTSKILKIETQNTIYVLENIPYQPNVTRLKDE